jgi:hypothetical protein
LQYLRARYYDTGIGRFTTRDTYEGDYQYPLTLNRWMYVNGNPIVFTDPSGNFCLGGGTGPCSEDDDTPGKGYTWDYSSGMISFGGKIANYAISHYSGYGDHDYSECTIFASDSLINAHGSEANLDDFDPYSINNRTDANEFYSYLMNNNGSEIRMENGIEYFPGKEAERGLLYEDENFMKLLASNLNNIHPGDFVFYATNDPHGKSFTHVAVVVGRGYDYKKYIDAPLITDADGPPDISLPRFIYETENSSIFWVVIVHPSSSIMKEQSKGTDQ